MDNIPTSINGRGPPQARPRLAHLHACDTALVFVSRTPVDQIEAFRKRIGWQMPWFSTMDDFNADCDSTITLETGKKPGKNYNGKM